MITTLFLLLILFQFKHFFADYPLQGQYMLGKFKPGYLWVLPLLAHVSVHGLFTFIITVFFTNWYFALFLSFLDMFIHFFMDRLKASPNLLGKFKSLSATEFTAIITKQAVLNKKIEVLMADSNSTPQELLDAASSKTEFMRSTKHQYFHNKLFWICLGFDQLVHHLTDLLLIYILVTHAS